MEVGVSLLHAWGKAQVQGPKDLMVKGTTRLKLIAGPLWGVANDVLRSFPSVLGKPWSPRSFSGLTSSLGTGKRRCHEPPSFA